MKKTWSVISEYEVIGFLGLGHSVGDVIRLSNREDEYLVTCVDVASEKYIVEPIASYEVTSKTQQRLTDAQIRGLIHELNQLKQENQHLREQISVLSETYRESRLLYEQESNISEKLGNEVKRLRQIADDWKETAGLMATKARTSEESLYQIYETAESMGGLMTNDALNWTLQTSVRLKNQKVQMNSRVLNGEEIIKCINSYAKLTNFEQNLITTIVQMQKDRENYLTALETVMFMIHHDFPKDSYEKVVNNVLKGIRPLEALEKLPADK